MSASASPRRRQPLRALPLRMLDGGANTAARGRPGRRHDGPPRAPGGGLRLVEERPCILLAGADPARRAALREELAQTLPASTPFEEAGEVAEVLEHAPSSGIVMLTGDLEDTSAESLMHMLGQRHPRLPVVALGVPPTPPLDGVQHDALPALQ